MLKTRVLTAVIALILFLSALFYLSPIFWMAVLLTLVLAGAMEWSKLAKFSAAHSTIYLMFTVLLGGELL
jgi:phosphatidate cytidylyltransferase